MNSLRIRWETNFNHFWEPTSNSGIESSRRICARDHEHCTRVLVESIHHIKQLGFKGVRATLLIRASLAQHTINLIEEDNARLQLLGQGKCRLNQLTRFAVILVLKHAHRDAEKRSASLFGEGARKECLPGAGGAGEQDSTWHVNHAHTMVEEYMRITHWFDDAGV